MIALGVASAAPAAGKGGSTSAASSSGAKAGATGSGRAVSGSAPAPVRSGSTGSTGGGMYATRRTAPELDPARKISEQDCTKPIVLDAGNLRCK